MLYAHRLIRSPPLVDPCYLVFTDAQILLNFVRRLRHEFFAFRLRVRSFLHADGQQFGRSVLRTTMGGRFRQSTILKSRFLNPDSVWAGVHDKRSQSSRRPISSEGKQRRTTVHQCLSKDALSDVEVTETCRTHGLRSHGVSRSGIVQTYESNRCTSSGHWHTPRRSIDSADIRMMRVGSRIAVASSLSEVSARY